MNNPWMKGGKYNDYNNISNTCQYFNPGLHPGRQKGPDEKWMKPISKIENRTYDAIWWWSIARYAVHQVHALSADLDTFICHSSSSRSSCHRHHTAAMDPKRKQSLKQLSISDKGNEMGRKKIELDPDKINELAAKGMTQAQMAKELGVSHPTLARRIADLSPKKGVLINYRAIQALHLTMLQHRVLEAIAPEKIADASLPELVKAYGILKKAELAMVPLKINIFGLEEYLSQLEEAETK